MTIILFITFINVCIIHTTLSIYLCLSVRLLVFSYVSVSVFVVCPSICLSLSVLLSVWFFVVCVTVCLLQVTCLSTTLSTTLSLRLSLNLFASLYVSILCCTLCIDERLYIFNTQFKYKSIYIGNIYLHINFFFWWNLWKIGLPSCGPPWDSTYDTAHTMSYDTFSKLLISNLNDKNISENFTN